MNTTSKTKSEKLSCKNICKQYHTNGNSPSKTNLLDLIKYITIRPK
jgi:hypothetical protein